jgi:hypothetical protein
MPEKWSCFIGFFMTSSIPFDYPVVRLVLEVAPSSPKRKEIIAEMRKISSQFGWKINILENSDSWDGISLDRSLKDFISKDDHVYEIEKFFLDALEELEKIRQQYPKLPWGYAVEVEVDDDELESTEDAPVTELRD